MTTKEKFKDGTRVDISAMVGRLRDDLSGLKVRVPSLNFSIKEYADALWCALWHGSTLPFRFKINDEVDRPTFWARITFAATFVIADSVYLVGKSGVWMLKKLIPGSDAWKVLITATGVIAFLGWGLPWFLDRTGFIAEIEQTKIMKMIGEITLSKVTLPDVTLLNVGWLVVPFLVGWIGAAPFSVVRFKKWRGFKALLRKKSKPIIGDDE